MNKNFFIDNKHVIISFVIFLFLVVSFTTIFLPHKEADELIYQTLGKQLASFQPYTLQGTKLLKYLPQNIYNTPLFFRPPAFVIYLSILYKFLGVNGFRISPVIIYVLLCFTIYKIVLQLTKSQNNAMKALVLSALSSLLLFSSVQIHLDLFMTLMASLSFYFLILFRESDRLRHLFLSGVFLMLSVMTNYTAALLYPFFVFSIIHRFRSKHFLNYLLLFLLPALVALFWFYNVIVIHNMPLTSLFSVPNRNELSNFEFINYVYSRPIYYYFFNIFITNPLNLFIFLLIKKDVRDSLRLKYGKFIYLLLSIIMTILIFMTLYGIQGGTYQMRYVLLAEPFLIILLSLIPFEEISFTLSLFWFFALYNLLLVFYNVGYGNTELFSFLEIFKRWHPS